MSERPPYSYMAMIQFAINSRKNRRMTLKEIYMWIEDHFPYFREVAKPGWKVLLNLSIVQAHIYCSRSQIKPTEYLLLKHALKIISLIYYCRIPSAITSLCTTCSFVRHHQMVRFLSGPSGLRWIDASLLIRSTRWAQTKWICVLLLLSFMMFRGKLCVFGFHLF